MKEVRKGQYGFPVITISPKEYLNKGAEVILKTLEPFGKAISSVVANLPQGGASAVLPQQSPKNFQQAKQREKIFEEKVGPTLSPSNHVVAWTQGSWNPRVGQQKIAEWGPLAQLGSLGVDAIGFKYIPKGVKATAKGTKGAVTKAIKNSKAKEVSKTIDKVVDEGFKPRLSSDKNLYRTTTDKEVSALKSGHFEVHPNGGNHGVYGWRRGEPFYQPGSWVESKMVGKRNGLSGVDNPTYLVAPIKEDLQVRIGSGGKYGEPVPATEVESGTHAYYHPSGGLAYDNSSIGFLPGDKLPNGIVAWSKKNGKWQFEPIEQPKQIYRTKINRAEPSTSLKFFERQPSKISRSERAGVPKQERNFTPKRHIAYYPGYQLKGLMKGSPLEKQLSKAGTINVKQLRAHFNKASQIERDIVNQVLGDRVWGDNINYNQFKKAVQDKLITYNRKPQTKYEDYGMESLGFETQISHDGDAVAYNEITGDFEQVAPFTPFKPNYQLNTFTFESPRLPLGNSKHYDASTLGHSRTFTTLEEPKVLHVMESQSDWGQTKLGDNAAPYTGTTKYLNDPAAYRKFIDGHKRLLAKMQENPSDYQAGAIEKQIANIERHEAILKQMLGQGGWNPQAKYLHDNYLQRQLQENLKYASEHGQTLMRYPTPETAAKIEGYTKTHYTPEYQALLDELDRLSRPEGDLAPVPDEISLFNDEPIYYTPEKRAELIRDIENKIADISIEQKDFTYSPQHQTILKKYADFPKMFQKLFRGHPVEIVTDSKGNTWYQVNVPKGYLNKEWQYKKGGKTHKPFGHRSILDNGWQSTKQLKNKKNVYGK